MEREEDSVFSLIGELVVELRAACQVEVTLSF